MAFIDSVNDNLADALIPIRISEPGDQTEDGRRGGEAAITFVDSGEQVVVPAVFVESPLTKREAGRFMEEGVLVVAEQIPPSVAETLRRRGMMFVDQRGNCFYRDAQRMIDVRGRVGGARPRKGTRALNLFTPKRAQVAAMVVSYPHVLALPVEDIAKTAGVSFGTVVNTLKVFVEAGYLTRPGSTHSVARDRFNVFLNAWADAFPTGLGSNLEVFRGDGDVARLAGAIDGAWVSGEAAVPEKVRGGDTLHLYIEDSRKLPGYLRKGRLRSSSSGDIVIRSSFWDLSLVPPGGIETPQIDTAAGLLPQVPLALLYADLRGAGDPRLREISESIRDELQKRARDA